QLAGFVQRSEVSLQVMRVDDVIRVFDQLTITLLAFDDRCLGALLVGDVVDHYQVSWPSGKIQLVPIDIHLDDRAVLFLMLPNSGRVVTFRMLAYIRQQGRNIVCRPYVQRAHLEKLFARITIMSYR